MTLNNIYLGLIGGLGDIIYGYHHNDEWRCLADYKKLNPEARVKAIIVSYNPEAYKIVELNPYIDEVVQHPPKREMRDKKWHQDRVIGQYAEGFSSFKAMDRIHLIRQTLPLHIAPEEKPLVDQFSIGKTAIIHPFASDRTRIPFPPYEYRRVVDRLCGKGFNKVICLGGTHTKSFGPNEQYDRAEEFDYHKGGQFLNLVNNTNVRVSTALVASSDLFVGTWSCYGITAWICGIKSIVAVPKGMWEGCSRIHKGKYKNHHQHDKIFEIDERTTIKTIVRAI